MQEQLEMRLQHPLQPACGIAYSSQFLQFFQKLLIGHLVTLAD